MKHNCSNKLISKRTFNRKVSLLKQDYAWFLQNKPFEIRPGWIDLLACTLTKIKSILINENISESNLKYLYCSTYGRLQLFIDATCLTESQGHVINHLIAEAQDLSERICPKCGVKCLARAYKGCDDHNEFDGDFLEDFHIHQASNDVKVKGDVVEQLDDIYLNPNSSKPIETNLDNVCSDRPKFHLYSLDDVYKVKHNLKNRSSDAEGRNRIKSICDELISLGGDRQYCTLPELEAFEDLAASFPNFSETINTVRSSVALAKLGNGVLEIPPLLLVGPPGIGNPPLLFI